MTSVCVHDNKAESVHRRPCCLHVKSTPLGGPRRVEIPTQNARVPRMFWAMCS
eukprot:jgi/Botrbrau1/6368/Bobra.0098s0027.1